MSSSLMSLMLLARKRGGSNNQHNDGVLNQLLTMIDGFTALTNIIVIGITNRKDILDEAVLRPGRFDVHLYIGLPDQKGREEIFKIHAKELIEEQHLDTAIIHGLTKRMANFSGAEIESVIKNAKTLVLRRHIDINDVEASLDKIPDDLQFTADDFIAAMSEIQPAFGSRYYVVPNSLSRPQAPLYDKITKELLSASLTSELLSSASNHNKNMLIHGSSKVVRRCWPSTFSTTFRLSTSTTWVVVRSWVTPAIRWMCCARFLPVMPRLV